MTRTIDALLCLSVFVIAALACGGGSPRRSAQIASTAPSAFVSAAEPYSEFEANEVAADQRFKGKVIAVQGTVQSIGKDILDTPYVSLNVGPESFGSVQAMFGKADEGRLAGLSKGREVTVKCRCEGKLMNVLLRDCVLQ